MRKVKVQDALGMVLCHDITRIVPGQFKGPAFKKGHVVTSEDIPELLNLGKDHLYVWECGEDYLHENEAAIRIAGASAGKGISLSDPAEGKVNYLAEHRGLLKINVEGLNRVNSIEEVIISTRHTNQVVGKGDLLAGTRVIPLVIKKEKIEQVEEICGSTGPLLEVREMLPRRTGLVTTGNEVYYGRIQDRFGPVIREKLKEFDCEVFDQVILPDDLHAITAAVQGLAARGAEMIITTGGMSVDPDDVTPAAVRATGAEIVSYGAPVLPGAMFLVAFLGDIPVLGLPACVMYFKATVFDLILPRVLAGERLTRKDLAGMGHGGLCLGCSQCRYPLCSFGKC